MKCGYYLNKQEQLVIVTPDKKVSVWSETNSKWTDFIILRPEELHFKWEFLGNL